MPKTSIIINQNPIYNLRNYYNQSMPSWQKILISSELKIKLQDESISLEDIFFVIMSQTNRWHNYTHYSPNPIIKELFQLPAAQACITLNTHQLLTPENCYLILNNERPEQVNAAILSLSHCSILNKESLDLALHQVMPHYVSIFLILLQTKGLPIVEATKLFPTFDRHAKLIHPCRTEELHIKLDGEDMLAEFFSILYSCSLLTPQNITLFEKSNVFLHSEVHPDTLQTKLYRLIGGMQLLKTAKLMMQERFNDLLENILSQAFFQTLELLSTGYSLENHSQKDLLTASNYERVKKSLYERVKKSLIINSLHNSARMLHEYGVLTMETFIEVAESDQPKHLALILIWMYAYRNVHQVHLEDRQYYKIKFMINLEQFSGCLHKLQSSRIDTQDNINNLIDYGDMLFSKSGENIIWKQVSHITQKSLDEIFLQCKQIGESKNTVDQVDEYSSNRINRLLAHGPSSRKEPHINQEQKTVINDSEIENDPLIEAIQKIILKRLEIQSPRIFLMALQEHKIKTLREAFYKLEISITQVQCNEKFLFYPEILDSKDIFERASITMIAFALGKISEEEQTRQMCLH